MLRTPGFPVVLATLVMLFVITSCSGGGNPVTGSLNQDSDGLTSAQLITGQSNRQLWAYGTVVIDTETWTAEVYPMRATEFHVNALRWMQSPSPQGVSIAIVNASQWSQGRLDIDVTIKHPFPIPQFTGFDLMTVFITDGNYNLLSKPTVTMNDLGDQDATMLNPDGYTRWFNQDEFFDDPITIFSYIHGSMSINGFSQDARINPYKYYATGLTNTGSLPNFLKNNPDNRGLFQAGMSNTRLMQLDWPVSGSTVQLMYDYAVVASWKQPVPKPPQNVPGDFPLSANALEPVAVNIIDNSTLVYDLINGITGGNISLDVEVFGWQGLKPGVQLADTIGNVYIELIDSPQFPGGDFTQVNPVVWSFTGGGVNWSTMQVEFNGLTTSASGDTPVMLIIETIYDYNQNGPSPYASGPLTSYFYFKIPVDDQGFQLPPVCDSPVPQFTARNYLDVELFTVNVSDPNGDPFDINWSFEPEGDPYVWQPNPDSVFVNWYAVTNNGSILGNYDIAISAYNGDGYAFCNTIVTVANTPNLGLEGEHLLNPQPNQGIMKPDIAVTNTGSGSRGTIMEQLASQDTLRVFNDSYSSSNIKLLSTANFAATFPAPELGDVTDWEDFSRFDSNQQNTVMHLASGSDASSFNNLPTLDINDPNHGWIMPFNTTTGTAEANYLTFFGDLGNAPNTDPDNVATVDNRWKYMADWTNGVTGTGLNDISQVYGLMTVSDLWPGSHSGRIWTVYSPSPWLGVDIRRISGLSSHNLPIAGPVNDDDPTLMSLAVDDANPWEIDFINNPGTDWFDTVQVFYMLDSVGKIVIVMKPEDYNNVMTQDPDFVIWVASWLGAGGAWGINFGTNVPVDIEVMNTTDVNGSNNYLAVLLDKPGNGWLVNLYSFDIKYNNVQLVTSYDNSTVNAGTPMRLDVDPVEDEVHVLHNDGANYRVTVLDLI